MVDGCRSAVSRSYADDVAFDDGVVGVADKECLWGGKVLITFLLAWRNVLSNRNWVRAYFSKLLVPFLDCDAHSYCFGHLACRDYDADLVAGEALWDDWFAGFGFGCY